MSVLLNRPTFLVSPRCRPASGPDTPSHHLSSRGNEARDRPALQEIMLEGAPCPSKLPARGVTGHREWNLLGCDMVQPTYPCCSKHSSNQKPEKPAPVYIIFGKQNFDCEAQIFRSAAGLQNAHPSGRTRALPLFSFQPVRGAGDTRVPKRCLLSVRRRSWFCLTNPPMLPGSRGNPGFGDGQEHEF